jgi:hypothetical protein
MVYVGLIKNFIFDVAGRLIPTIAKKIYPQSEYENHIRISARATNPLSFNLRGGNFCPEADIYLSITNLSPYLDAEIKQIEITVLLGGTSIIKRYKLPFYEIIPHANYKDVYILKQLNCFQVEKLRDLKNKERNADIQVELLFSSKLYTIKKLEYIRNIHCEIVD